MATVIPIESAKAATGIRPERITILRNAVAPAFETLQRRAPPFFRTGAPPILAYTSTPFRGLAVLLMLGSFHLDQARLDLGREQARQARELLPAWPEPRRVTAVALVFASRTENRPELLVESRRWRRAAVARDPTDPALWSELAAAELEAGLVGPAGRHYQRALHFDPWSVRALNGLGRVALAQGRRPDADRYFRRSLLVNPRQPSIQRLLSGGG